MKKKVWVSVLFSISLASSLAFCEKPSNVSMLNHQMLNCMWYLDGNFIELRDGEAVTWREPDKNISINYHPVKAYSEEEFLKLSGEFGYTEIQFSEAQGLRLIRFKAGPIWGFRISDQISEITFKSMNPSYFDLFSKSCFDTESLDWESRKESRGQRS